MHNKKVVLGNQFETVLKLLKSGNRIAAKDAVKNILKKKPDNFQALKLLGNLESGFAALDIYKKALVINPRAADVYYDIGVTWHGLLDYANAIANYDAAIELRPNYQEAHSNKGAALKELKDYPNAMLSYIKAIELDPNKLQDYANLIKVLIIMKRYDVVNDVAQTALSIDANNPEIYSARSGAWDELGRMDEALSDINKAIDLEPTNPDYHYSKSFLLLKMGRLIEGFAEYEWRIKKENLKIARMTFDKPLLSNLSGLSGKRIFIYSEQGLGDDIQFVRYLAVLKKLGAHVIVKIPLALLSIFSSLDFIDEILTTDESIPDFDCYCSMMSLPYIFKTDLESIPTGETYLFSSPVYVKKWNQELGPKTTPRIGLVWSGSTGHVNDINRSIPYEVFDINLPKEYDYFCLQKEIRNSDRISPSLQIKYFDEKIEGFQDTMALIDHMDVIISVDTSVAHLAAAMGKVVFLLLPFNPDWRWLLNRDDSPWYPSVKIYRKSYDLDWNSIFKILNPDLTFLLSGNSSSSSKA